ncbi:MAG: hypothetical protein DRG78_21745 [Epsilonproteobacteria bacterium]|nr:MAG: hypothetical protein DRG78_21745 [Campylobacterota bacterium]
MSENNEELRKTEIIEIEEGELEDELIDELQDEIFDNLKDAMIKESRLLKRYYDFCFEYNSFEFDEMGMNMEEAEEVLQRANKIRDILMSNISNITKYEFASIKTDEVYYKILFDIIIEDGTKHCIIEVDIDSFDLEVY